MMWLTLLVAFIAAVAVDLVLFPQSVAWWIAILVLGICAIRIVKAVRHSS
jgi:hypothetical protein